jgi:hypothetical protein
MIHHKEFMDEFKKQIKVWREYKKKILELQENYKNKKSKDKKDSDESKDKKDSDESKDKKDKKDSDESKDKKDSDESKDKKDSDESKDKKDSDESKDDKSKENNNDGESKDSDKSKDNKDACNDIDIKKKKNDDTFIDIGDTIETEYDDKNTTKLKNDIKKKTNFGKKILKALRLLFLRLMVKTHPDKVGEKFLMQFKEAKNAHENHNIDDLLMIAIEVNSSIENLPIDIDIKVLLEAIIYKIEIFKRILNENL